MKPSDSKLREFETVWETLQLEDRPIEFGQTETMRPAAPTVRAQPYVTLPKLPTLVQRAGEDTIPEVEVEGLLGIGGMGEVRLAQQVPVGRQVAVKTLRKEYSSPESTMILLREGWTTGLLEHPNIVPIYTLGRDADGDPMIVMKRIEGVSWLELMQDPSKSPRQFDSDDPLDWHIEILTQVCNAVHFAHSKGIIHRDIKPENIMIGAFGEVYLLDWGIAVSVDEAVDARIPAASGASAPAGTPQYMAPEMVSDDIGELGPRTDVYLLGATLHEVLTGEPPHGGAKSLFQVMFAAYHSPPPELGNDVPEKLADICRRAMARRPEDRYESAEAFRAALVDYTRHRESIRLTDEATERLEQLRDALTDDGADEADARIYKYFGEARFGFEQALEIAADNERARAGLQEVLELMVERELERGGYQAASLLVADLPEPRPDLEERIEQLRAQLVDREEEFEKLKKASYESDVEVARHTRSIFAAVLGLVWGTIAITRPLFEEPGATRAGYTDYLIELGVVAGVVALATYLGRHALMRNEANRKMLASFVLVFLGSWGVRILGKTYESQRMLTALDETLIFGVGGGVMAITLDARFWWAVVPYVLGSFLGPVFPEHTHLVFGLTNYVSLGLLAWAWWPKSRRRRA